MLSIIVFLMCRKTNAIVGNIICMLLTLHVNVLNIKKMISEILDNDKNLKCNKFELCCKTKYKMK